MEITLHTVADDQKAVLERLLQLCIHDYSEFESIKIGSEGIFHYRWLDFYFSEPSRHPFFIHVDGELAGFVLIREGCGKQEWAYQIAEFFILRTFRGRGIGKGAALKALDQFSGIWETSFCTLNKPAAKLWRSVADCFEQTRLKKDPQEDNRRAYLIETQASRK
jgi:predicted acetyltransferase